MFALLISKLPVMSSSSQKCYILKEQLSFYETKTCLYRPVKGDEVRNQKLQKNLHHDNTCTFYT